MTSRERIIQFVEFKKISKNQFYKETGLSNGFLDKNNHPGADKLEQIIYTYPEINPTWLLTGKGNMLLDEVGARLNKYTQKAEGNADLYSKAITWIIFSMYEKQTGRKFSFDGFPKLADIFNLASTYADVMQMSLETELFTDTVKSIQAHPNINDDGAFILPESLTKSIDKYVETYEKLETICLDIMAIVGDSSIQKEILEYYKIKSSKE
jgi:hypothetical protein